MSAIHTVMDLDGRPVRTVEEGREYLVPCVYGIPVITPSHIDEGNEGQTSRHWHTDDRFGNVGRDTEFWSQVDRDDFGMIHGDSLRASIIKDNGEEIALEKMKAVKSEMWPSGGVFSSVCWLYEHYGTRTSKDGYCTHHRTPMAIQGGCYECPAHGLKFKLDGSPRYQAPFYISTRYIDHDHNIHRVREPLKTGKDAIVFSVEGNYDPFPVIRLEDEPGECIMEMKAPHQTRTCVGRNTLTISIGAWPLDGKCPSLAPCDPRNREASSNA